MARQNLHEALKEEARLQEVLTLAEQDLEDLHADQQREQESGITADRLTLFAFRLDIVREENRQMELAREKQQQLVAQKRQLLVKASKDRKVMEKLRERQNRAYRQYLDKKETTTLDEIAVLFHDRK